MNYQKNKVPPRPVPDRDTKYMGIAVMYAGLSKDPNTQMGALIVSLDNEPLSFGYNGPPAKIDDTFINWDRSEKYDFIAHAEENAIDYSCGDLSESTIYVTGMPCKKCMLRIVRAKIRRVCYLERPYDPGSMQSKEKDKEKALEIAQLGKVKVEKFTGNLNWLGDWVMHMKAIGVLSK